MIWQVLARQALIGAASTNRYATKFRRAKTWSG